MPDRRPHDPHDLPKSMPPLETHEEYVALLAGLPEMERGLAMLPQRSPLRRPLARIVTSIRARVREYEAGHGIEPS